MSYRDNEPRASGWFINAARVQQVTSAFPDTTSDYSELRNIPFEELRKGFPRDPTLHVSRSADKLPLSLAVRLARIPHIGHIISDIKPSETHQYTSINPVDLVGNDFEMAEITAEGDVGNVEVRPEDFPRDGSTIASISTLENSEITLEEIAGSMPGATELMQGPGAAREDDSSGDMLTRAMETLKMTLPDTDIADNLHEALLHHSKTPEESNNEGVSAAAVDLVAALLPEPPGNPASPMTGDKKTEAGDTDHSSLGEGTSGVTPVQGHTGDMPKRIDDRKEDQQGPQYYPFVIEPPFKWISAEPALLDRYRVYDMTPDQLLSKIHQLSATVYELIESNSPEYFEQISAFRDLEWLESGREHLIRELETDMVSTEDEDSAEAMTQRDLRLRLHECAKNLYILSGVENVIGLTPAGIMTHMAYALKWNLIADRQVVTDVSRKLSVISAQTEDMFKEHSDKILAVYTSITDGIETDRVQRNVIQTDLEDLKNQIGSLKTLVSSLTTQVNNLTVTMAQVNFNARQPELLTDTRLPRQAPPQIPPTSKRAEPDRPTILATVKTAIAADLEALYGPSIADKEQHLTANLFKDQSVLAYYKGLEVAYDRVLSLAQLVAIDAALSKQLQTRFPRTAAKISVLNQSPPQNLSPLKHVLNQLCIPTFQKSVEPKDLGQRPSPSMVVTPQASVAQMSRAERRAKGLE